MCDWPQRSIALRSLTLPLTPYEDKREQDDVHSEGYSSGDLQAHVTSSPEKAAPFPAVGFSGRHVGIIVRGLRRIREELSGFSGSGNCKLTHHHLRPCSFGFPSGFDIVDAYRPTVEGEVMVGDLTISTPKQWTY